MQPACVLALRLRGQVTWRGARGQERRGERARDGCCGCSGREIAVADELLLALLVLLALLALLALLELLASPALLALRGSDEELATAVATAMLATATVMATFPMVRWWR